MEGLKVILCFHGEAVVTKQDRRVSYINMTPVFVVLVSKLSEPCTCAGVRRAGSHHGQAGDGVPARLVQQEAGQQRVTGRAARRARQQHQQHQQHQRRRRARAARHRHAAESVPARLHDPNSHCNVYD